MKRIFLPLLLLVCCNTMRAQDWWMPDWTPTIWYGDTVSFETPYTWFYSDTSENNIWQVGAPAKPVFNQAFSPPNAIVTDTLNAYPANNHSWFKLYLGEFNFSFYYGNNMYIEMKHRYDTDTLKDGGFIQVSYDNGNTWMNIIKDTVFLDVNPAWENLNLYNQSNTLHNGEFGFSGNSGGWVTTGFTWHYTPVRNSHRAPMGDTLALRFNFVSDSLQNNREGWMIDNIRLFAIDLGSSIGQVNLANKLFTLYPNPAEKHAMVRLNQTCHTVSYALFSASGKQILSGSQQNIEEFELNLSQIPAGMYILRLIADNRLAAFEKLEVR